MTEFPPPPPCQFCLGLWHFVESCPKVKAVEYENGRIVRVEKMTAADLMAPWPITTTWKTPYYSFHNVEPSYKPLPTHTV